MVRQTKSEAATGRTKSRRRGARLGIALAASMVLVSTLEAQAQTNYPPPRPSRGGIGAGGAIGIGIGLGVLGAIISQQGARAEPVDEPPQGSSGRDPRPVRVIEVPDDLPATRNGGDLPTKPRTVRTTERPPATNIRIPPKSETRYVPGEVLIEVKGNGPIEPIANRLGVDIVASQPIRLTGSTLHRVRARGTQTTIDVLTRLQKERMIAFAQPNWVYTLQQASAAMSGSTAAAPAPAPGAAQAPASGETALATAATPQATAPSPALPGQYAVEKLRLPAALGRSRGRDVRVAVIDTGADLSHPELAGAIEASYDALEGVDPAPGAHGTAMAGAIAARLRLSGTAPSARLLAARAFGPPAANGVAQGSTFHVVKCLDWSVEQGARVVSMSFAGPSNALLSRAVAAAQAKGVIAVAAAGNAGPQSPPLFPAAEPGVIAVTASDADDHILSAANRGAHVLVTAPGVDILVATPTGGYDLTSGTSVAAAEVSGVVALMLERRADLKSEEVRRILAETAIDLGPKGRDPIFGAGLVDADAAVGAASRPRPR